MKSKPGYKHSELGMLPEDWKVVQIGSMGTLAKGRGIRKDESKSGEIPCIRYGEIYTDHNDIVRFFNSGISAEVATYSKRLKKGDLLFAGSGETRAEIGKCVAFLGDDEAYAGGDIVIFTPSKGCSAFFGYLFNGPIVARQKANKGQGDAVVHINASAISSILIAIPSTNAEQEAIAEALSDADALIESLMQLLAKKRLVKQGAMQELLFPNDGWILRKLEDVAEIRGGGTPSTNCPEYWNGDVPWCTPTDITALDAHKYLNMTDRAISTLGLECSSAEIIPAGSILMTSRATIGECAINQIPVSTNQGFKNIIPFWSINGEFLFYLLLTKKQDFIKLCGGSTFLEIGKSQLASFEIKLPKERHEQTAIATILSDMDAEIAELEAKLAKARQIRQGMMQELLTGRIRLAPAVSKIISFPKAKKSDAPAIKAHNWQINEAVVIAVLAKTFGSEQYPLARVRRPKFAYLLHRHAEKKVDGYLKKAAGPYNPNVRYQGPEKIAQKNRYVRPHNNGTYEGFVAAENIAQAEAYFQQWYGADALTWLKQFRYRKTDELGLLTTVDMAIEDLHRDDKTVDLASVKQIIRNHPEWKVKLNQPIFSDANITQAILTCQKLFV